MIDIVYDSEQENGCSVDMVQDSKLGESSTGRLRTSRKLAKLEAIRRRICMVNDCERNIAYGRQCSVYGQLQCKP
jgi:hypothetical protein